MMKKLFQTAAILLILAVAVVGSVSAASDSTAVDDKVIHSTGTGKVIGTPDRAQITLSVMTQSTDLKVAQEENAAKMNKVIDALTGSGLPRDALRTSGYSIYPVYEENTGLLNPKIKTYQVTNRLTVTLHDVSKTGEVIDVAVANGINQADSIDFMLSEQQEQTLRTQALREAVDRARADADTVAAAMGTTINGIKNAQIEAGYSPYYFQNYQYAGDGALKSATPTPIQPGDITVTATVSISYNIR